MKTKVSNTSSVIWRAPIVATYGYQGNCRIEVFAVSVNLYSRISFQEAYHYSCRIIFLCMSFCSGWNASVSKIYGQASKCVEATWGVPSILMCYTMCRWNSPEEYINRSLCRFMQLTLGDFKCSIFEFGQILYILSKTVLTSYLCLS